MINYNRNIIVLVQLNCSQMNFKILENEDINKAVKRIGIELIDDSINRLKNIHKTFDESIHESRKNFKKMRGLLRLVRFELGDELYKKENKIFRNTGRILSPVRDAAVMIETLDYIVKKHPKEIDYDDYKQIRKNLNLRARKIRTQFKKNNELINKTIKTLAEHRNEFSKIPLRRKSFKWLIPGLSLVYKRGLDSLAFVKRSPSTKNYHEWRKQAKYLWYHTRILEEAWQEYMNILSNKLSDLSDVLGLEHDLSELRSVLLKEYSIGINKQKSAKLLKLIEMERKVLQTQAKSIAHYIYVEPAENFTNRIESYWNQSKKQPVIFKK